jgi:serine/threonine protein kinase
MLAVKLLKNTQQGQAESEFLSELGTLGRVRHRNLVALKGFCVSSEDCFLILDYAAGGNLDQALRNPTRPVLTWPQRMNIAVGAARGLSYLHNDCRPTIIHRDIKSANILLDADGEAEVAILGCPSCSTLARRIRARESGAPMAMWLPSMPCTDRSQRRRTCTVLEWCCWSSSRA